MNKNLVISCPGGICTLIVLIIYPITIPIFSLQMSGPAALLLLVGYYLVSELHLKGELIISVFAIMFGYVRGTRCGSCMIQS